MSGEVIIGLTRETDNRHIWEGMQADKAIGL